MASEHLTFDALKNDIIESIRVEAGDLAPVILNKKLKQPVSADEFLRLSFDNLLTNLAIAEFIGALQANDVDAMKAARTDLVKLTRRQFDNVQGATQRLMGGPYDMSGSGDDE